MLTEYHFLLEKAQCRLYNNNNNNRAIKRRSLTTAELPPHLGTGFSHFLCRLEGITTSLINAGMITIGPAIEI